MSIRQLSGEVRTNPLMRREAYSMSLYVAIILLSVLWVFDDDHPPAQYEVFFVEAGATVGLVLAHGFASWVSTRIIGDVAEEVDPGDLLLVQIGGALAVAGVSMLAVLVAPTSVELQAARLTVAVSIAAMVFLETRSSHSTARAALNGLLALATGVFVASIKGFLSH